ncbi:MAG: DUF4352 domain-containing protein [Fimbriimonadaceae bacterium]
MGQTLVGKELLFTVSKMIVGDHYQKRLSAGTIEPPTPGANIVAFVCLIRNTGRKTMSIGFLGTNRTALADTDEHTYPPLTGSDSDLPTNGDILPGSVADFVLTFSMPKTEAPKALIYQTAGINVLQSTFRFTLPPPAPS